MRGSRAAVLAVATALAGCGGGNDGGSDEDAVEQTMRDVFAATDEGDAARACDLHTDRYNQAAYGGREGCIERLEEVGPGDPGKRELSEIEVDGDEATVRVVLDDVTARTWILKREDGRFKIDDVSRVEVLE